MRRFVAWCIVEETERRHHVVWCVPQILRPHQRHGVKFLWKVVTGQAESIGEGYQRRHGAILADEMGVWAHVCGWAGTMVRQRVSAKRRVEGVRAHRVVATPREAQCNCAVCA